MNKKMLRSLMIGSSTLAMTLSVNIAYAQSADEPSDEVVVTGIRKSLQDSMNIKRDSQGIVDAISAEDIGKFPDTNLAESLQRITGVSIDRSLGEGSSVTVRGFGADFNLVTLNGRQMPTSSLGDSQSAPSSRSYDFGNIASENIAGVDVYKTSRADVATGGIGATINIRTTKPLDADGRIATVGIKGMYDKTQIDGSSVTPEISGLYSNKFANDTIGVALSGSYQNRQGGVTEFVGYDNGWHDGRLMTSDFENEWGALPVTEGSWNYWNHQYGTDPENPTFGAGAENGPDAGAAYEIPQKHHYGVTDFERERINGQLVLQYEPMENLRATADYTFASNEVDAQRNTAGIWYNYAGSRSVWTSGPVAGPEFYTDLSSVFDPNLARTDLSYEGGRNQNKSENHSLGFNLAWQPSEALALELDYHNSQAESKPVGNYGSQAVLGTAVVGVITQGTDLQNDLPIVWIEADPDVDPYDPANRYATGMAFRNAYMKDKLQQLQFRGSYEVNRDIIDSVDFGASYIENKVRSAFGTLQNNSWGGLGSPDDYPDELFTALSVPDLFDGVDGADDPRILREIGIFDAQDLTQVLEDRYQVCSRDPQNLPDGHALTGIASGTAISGTCLAEFDTDRRLEEKTFSGYVQFNNSFNMFDRKANLIAGGRFEQTDVTSTALVPTYQSTIWSGDNEFNLVPTGVNDFTTAKGDYFEFLPNLYLDMQPLANSKFRLTYSHTIARQTYDKLEGGLALGAGFGVDFGGGSQGNPGLDPYKSKNFDASYEWYYGDDSYVSVGFYAKDVENFTGGGQYITTVDGLYHPAHGPRSDEARVIYGENAAPGAIRSYIRDTYYGGVGAPEGQVEDDLVSFRIGIPVVSEDTLKMNGWEFALQHMFGDSGFGAILNYTLADGDFDYDNAQPYNVTPGQFALPGLSDSANIVGFYDKNGFQARLAWNWRDEFLAGSGSNPWYTEAYHQLDGNISYEFMDGFTVFAEAINLTGEDRRGHRRHENNVTFYSKQDPRFALGGRYKF